MDVETTGNITGDVSTGDGEINNVLSEFGNISGNITDSDGYVGTLTAGKSISGTITATDGNIYDIYAGQNIGGAITASGSGYGQITYVAAPYGSVSATIAASGGIGTLYSGDTGVFAGLDVTGSVSSLTGDIVVMAGRDITGPVNGGTVSSYLVLSAGHDITGDVRGNAIASMTAGTDITSSTILASGDVGTITAGHGIATTTINATGSIATITAGFRLYSPFTRGTLTLWDGTAAGEIRNATITAGGSIGLVGAFAMAGHTGSIHDTTITAAGGDIGTLTATDGMPNNVTATAHGSFGVIDPGDGALTGSYTAQTGGLPSITAADSYISAGLFAAGTIGNITALGSIAGAVTATGSIGDVTSLLGNMSASITSYAGSIGNLTAGLDITGNITSVAESIGDITAGGNLSGNVSAHTDIGSIVVGGTLSGYLATLFGSIGGVTVLGNITNFIAAGDGALAILSLSSVTGSISGAGNITLTALGSVSGNVEADSGNILVTAKGNIASGTITAAGNIALVAGGNITASVTSDLGVFEEARRNITSTVVATVLAQLNASSITDSTVTADNVHFSAGMVSASHITAPESVSVTAPVIYGSTINGMAQWPGPGAAPGTYWICPNGIGIIFIRETAAAGGQRPAIVIQPSSSRGRGSSGGGRGIGSAGTGLSSGFTTRDGGYYPNQAAYQTWLEAMDSPARDGTRFDGKPGDVSNAIRWLVDNGYRPRTPLLGPNAEAESFIDLGYVPGTPLELFVPDPHVAGFAPVVGPLWSAAYEYSQGNTKTALFMVFLAGVDIGTLGADTGVRATVQEASQEAARAALKQAAETAAKKGAPLVVDIGGQTLKIDGKLAAELCEDGCFAPGTPVLTENGRRPIEQIQAGDRIWAYDAVAGEWSLEKVLRPLIVDYVGKLVTVRTQSGELSCTPAHPFWVAQGFNLFNRPIPEDIPLNERVAFESGRWVAARDLREGDHLLTKSGGILAITAIGHAAMNMQVHNLVVDRLHTFAVGGDDILVHNLDVRDCERILEAADKGGAAGGAAGNLALRAAYVNEVKSLRNVAESALASGESEEEVARMVSQMRREIGIKYKDLTPPDELARITARNIAKYGDPLGPTIEWLRARGKSWRDIIESALRTGGKDLGY